jgi:hypothetical protein
MRSGEGGEGGGDGPHGFGSGDIGGFPKDAGIDRFLKPAKQWALRFSVRPPALGV